MFTACFSRYLFVYLTFSTTLEDVIAGCEDAWAFFGGVFRVVVPDNMSLVVAKAGTVILWLTREWLEYAQARGFVTDPPGSAIPGISPGSSRCEIRAGKFLRRGNLPGPGRRAGQDDRVAGTANARVHGTTRQVPAVGSPQEAPCLLPALGYRGRGAVLGGGESPRRLPPVD